MDARTKVANNFLLLAYKAARAVKPVGMSNDTSNSVAHDALLRAMDKYQEGRGTGFAPYLRVVVKNEVCKRWKKDRRIIEMSQLAEVNDAHDSVSLDFDAIHWHDIMSSLPRGAWAKIWNTLNDREKSVVSGIILGERSSSDPELLALAAPKTGGTITRQRVRQIYDRAVARLRDGLAKYGVTRENSCS
jgi:DNA-directed RNA polymerase specialized sigma24 family protein